MAVAARVDGQHQHIGRKGIQAALWVEYFLGILVETALVKVGAQPCPIAFHFEVALQVVQGCVAQQGYLYSLVRRGVAALRG